MRIPYIFLQVKEKPMFDIKRYDLIKEEIYETVLSNGLRLTVIPKKGFAKQFAMYAADYGSNNIKFYPVGTDKPVEVPLGIAHFLEHKMFDNEGGVNVFEKFAKYGAQPNAFTSYDMTAYYFTSTDDFYKNLGILMNYVNSPYFTEESVEKEKGIIAQEITMYDDEPDWALIKGFLNSVYFNHPVKNDIAGDVKSISGITHDMLYLCYNSFYNPENMALVMSGDISPDEALKYAERFAAEDKREIPHGKVRKCTFHEPEGVVKNLCEQRMDISRPKILYGFKDIHTGLCGRELLKRKIALQTALEIFAGRSSELYCGLYEKRITDDSFYCGYDAKNEYAYGYFAAETDRYDELVNEIKSAVISAKKNGLDKNAFGRVKKSFIGSLLRIFNRPESLVTASTRHIFAGINIFDYYDVLDKLSFEEVQSAFDSVLDDKYCAVSIIKPVK